MYSIRKGLVDDKMEARINFRNILDKMIETSSEARKHSYHTSMRSKFWLIFGTLRIKNLSQDTEKCLLG